MADSDRLKVIIELVKNLVAKVNEIDGQIKEQARELTSFKQSQPSIQMPSVHSESQTIETELVEIYRRYPQTLYNQAIKVAVIQESPTSEQTILAERRKGSYWIIKTQDTYCLVPKDALKVNEYNYEALNLLFDCQNYSLENGKQFTLIQPAKVSLTANQTWQLEERGILQFGESSSVLNSSLSAVPLLIQEEFRQLQLQQTRMAQEQSQLQSQIKEILARLNQLDRHFIPYPDQTSNNISAEAQETQSNQNLKLLEKLEMSPQEAQLVSDYDNPALLLKDIIPVAETPESSEQRNRDPSLPVILERNRWGNFWLIDKGEAQYLVPQANNKINLHQDKTVLTLFKCYGKQLDEDSQFQLLKPAKIASVSRKGDKWGLIEPGVLLF